MEEESHKSPGSKIHWFEPAAALLMAISSLCTAWCSYQNSRWSGQGGDQATHADKLARQVAAQHLEARQIEAIQTRMWMEAMDARIDSDEPLARFYTERFTEELKPAYDKWIALDPFGNPTVSQMTFRAEDGHSRQFTWRTIQTWWYYYRRYGITDSPERSDKGAARKVAPEHLLEAIEKILPAFHGKHHNISEVYRACIEKGLLRREQVAPNTFRRHVKRFDLLKPASPVSPKARLAFAKAHANDMWQADTLHGPFIRIAGKPVKTFLICFIDDASRVVPHGAFYANDSTPNLIDCFQTAIYKRGMPKAMYVDNGSNYSSAEFAGICTRLGTVLIHTPVRDGAAKGKIERFFRTVREQFLLRDLSAITSLDALNREFIRWVEDTYHAREHATLGMKPIDRFGLDLSRIRYLASSAFNAELFFLEDTRKVRADNTFLFNNVRYEAPRDLRGMTISIRYDRYQPASAPAVYHGGQRLGLAEALDAVANDRRPFPSF